MKGGPSYWVSSTADLGFPPLAGDRKTTVVVVGGGIAGLSTAVLLKQAGCAVTVLESGRVGTGVTGRTTGKVTAQHGLAYSRLESLHGRDASRTYAESQSAGVELVVRLAEELAIDCDLERVPNYVFAEHEDETEQLEEELAASRRAGLAAVVEDALDAPFPARLAIRLDGQAQFHARKYVLGLARSVDGDDGAVHEQTRVRAVRPGPPPQVETDQGTVTADHVVLATNAPITSRGRLFARALPWRSYVVAAALSGPCPPGMWINVGSPTRSMRTAPLPDGRRLGIVVGEGHRVGQDDPGWRYEALTAYLLSHFRTEKPGYRWSTQDLYSVDELPFIGRLGGADERLYVATGFGGWGLSNGSLAALLIRDAILGHANGWARLYDPTRSTLRHAAGTFLRENANVAKHLVAGKLRRLPGALADVPPGSGRIVDLDGCKAAVYRDESGNVHAVSAACTHKGCVVNWNATERSWDCPCHGSRFGVGGEILDGPATTPLEPVEVVPSV